MVLGLDAVLPFLRKCQVYRRSAYSRGLHRRVLARRPRGGSGSEISWKRRGVINKYSRVEIRKYRKCAAGSEAISHPRKFARMRRSFLARGAAPSSRLIVPRRVGYAQARRQRFLTVGPILDLPTKQFHVAERSGFGSASTFSRAFTMEFETPAKAYRKALNKKWERVMRSGTIEM